MQDVGELFHEAFEAVGEALDVVRIAVIGDHRRNRREEADRGGDQRLGDSGGDLGEGRLLDVGEAAERMPDAPPGAEEPEVGAHGAGRGEEGEVALDEVHLALEGGAHRAAGAVDHVGRVGAALAAQLGELAKARLEHALEAADAVAVVHRALVKGVQVVSAPELALALVGLRVGAPIENHFWKMNIHDMNDTPRRRNITILTTKLAWTISVQMSRSWVPFI